MRIMQTRTISVFCLQQGQTILHIFTWDILMHPSSKIQKVTFAVSIPDVCGTIDKLVTQGFQPCTFITRQEKLIDVSFTSIPCSVHELQKLQWVSREHACSTILNDSEGKYGYCTKTLCKYDFIEVAKQKIPYTLWTTCHAVITSPCILVNIHFLWL